MQPAIERAANVPSPSTLTLRDYFAIHVPDLALLLGEEDSYEEQARQRYAFADAMLKVRAECIPAKQ